MEGKPIIKRCMRLLVSLMPLLVVPFAQNTNGNGTPVRVALVKMPYVGERNVPDVSRGPDYLAQGGIQKLLEDLGVQTKQISTVALTADEEKAYGSWNHLALASGDLAKLVSEERRSGSLPVDFLANCTGILGMLSGLQHSGPTARPLRVAMVFIDAHGDFNTPETTLSGMLGGMPVAIFFFQAEDGIRDYKVTGVQTCALPISTFARQDTIACRGQRYRHAVGQPGERPCEGIAE